MFKQILLYGLLVVGAIVIFPPAVDGRIVIYVLFDVDLLMLPFTGESDPTVLSARFLDWYPNFGVPRLVVSCVLAGLAVYKFWKVDEGEPMLGTTAAGRRAKRFRAEDWLDEGSDTSLATPTPRAEGPMGDPTAEDPDRDSR